jgi:hypothetical protein
MANPFDRAERAPKSADPDAAVSRAASPSPPSGADDFLFGKALFPVSDLVASAKYHLGRKELEIRFVQKFLGGAVAFYEDVSEAEARDFYNATSKGSWVHANLFGPWDARVKRYAGLKKWH